MITDLGEIVFLPTGQTDEIRNDPRLSFGSAFGEDFHGHLPGFQGAAVDSYDDAVLQTLVRKQLTKCIGKFSDYIIFDESRRIIMPYIEKRRAARAAALASGKKIPEFFDAIDWADQEAATRGVTYDPAIMQLMLAVAAIHTTADLVTEIVLQLALHPEYVAPLREEVIHILRSEGLKKSSLHNMKLLDSALKEAQ
ncbi:Cytochrome P450 monooygenase 2, partial [Colletotrichum sp. SAR 10_65]